MPAPIFMTLLRNFFLEAGLNAFFDKVTLAMATQEFTKYDGKIESGMHFKRIMGKGIDPRDDEMAFLDAEILDGYSIYHTKDVAYFSYWHPELSERTTTTFHIKLLDFYL